LAESIATGKQKVVKVVDIDGREDELEGFTFMPGAGNGRGIAVTSSRKENVSTMHIDWK